MNADPRAHLLVVDDDDRLRSLLTRYLRKEGFAVSNAADAGAARALMELFAFDVLVLDVMMPGESGLSLAESLRANQDAPLMLMLSARSEASDRMAGLESGADDYLPKPFEPKELLLRVKALLRRAAPARAAVAFGDYIFALSPRGLTKHAEPVHLTSAEEALLAVLAEHLNAPLSREKLAELTGQAGSGRSIDVQVTRLRRKIEQETARPIHLRTMRGAGYVLQGRRV